MNRKIISNRKGFTIVELLIVIVVIGILAAITIVAFNGVQNRGKLASAQAAAVNVAKKAEAFNSLAGSYPSTLSTAGTGFDNYSESKMSGSGLGLVATAPVAGTGTNTVTYGYCSAGGAGVGSGRVLYWDYTTNAVSTTVQYVGPMTAALAAACTTWVYPTLTAGS